MLLKIFQRPQDAQPSPNGDDLGGLGGIPQQAFWPVQSGQNRKHVHVCIACHFYPEFGIKVVIPKVGLSRNLIFQPVSMPVPSKKFGITFPPF